MQNKYIVVRANSTSGPYIVERNQCAPRPNAWTQAEVGGYEETLVDAEQLARDLNRCDEAE